ncbi:DegT/DnrJ/EryC1/StrS family aminotransferase [Telmatospirillum sp. J64-1]|uniref:DegT/DnrJ/EryC1/StrS family aminotransferase n=1 Tax=Telmatospirillum sp. J64-1 TaxID=2502183 RepID=UPI00115EDF04|nr:DegT/DnrJ/EryC1/StrS family aminotransferase [Telmatospirillum sp. J64-1]
MSQAIVPVAKPLLPSAHDILPYLERMDQARWYSNGGILVQELRRRLAAHFGVQPGCVRLVGNGTQGLTAALLASEVRAGAYCVMPAWTFAASAQAVLAAGLRPYFIDVEAKAGVITPALVDAALPHVPGEVAAVMPVSPFGAPLDLRIWEEWRDRSGIPVIVDAAAGFDTCKPSHLPVMVSLHATKIFGVGEGGFLLCDDPAFQQEVEFRINFGFSGGREARSVGMNGKMSEYHAAVGLAQMDRWGETRAEFIKIAQAWREALAPLPDIRLQEGWGESWISATCVIEKGNAVEAARKLASHGIETRRWWERGLHRQPAFTCYSHAVLDVTEKLAERCLGLPFHVDLGRDVPRQVAALLA